MVRLPIGLGFRARLLLKCRALKVGGGNKISKQQRGLLSVGVENSLRFLTLLEDFGGDASSPRIFTPMRDPQSRHES